MVTHQLEMNDQCLSRRSLDEVLTVDKVCVASRDNHESWKRFFAKLLLGEDHVVFIRWMLVPHVTS